MHDNSTIHSSAGIAVLVTGSTGLVGSHLIPALIEKGYRVSALYRTEIPGVDHKEEVQWIRGDILDVLLLEDAMQNVQQVYHCAAIVSFSPSEAPHMMHVNVSGTTNVVNAALHAGVDKLCYVSSVAALGRIRQGQVVNESMYWSEETSNSVYGKSKYLAEMEVWRGIGEGLKAVIVNPSIILGAGNWQTGSTKIFKSVYEEFPWYTEGVSGFVDVNDVVSAMISLMESNVSAERFILNGDNISYRQLFTKIANAFGKKPPHKKVTPLIASVVWRAEALKSMITRKKPLITKETAVTAQATVRYDSSKIHKFLNGFSYTPLHEAIERICQKLVAKYNL
jgi:dihydroflavonol-4-reductase